MTIQITVTNIPIPTDLNISFVNVKLENILVKFSMVNPSISPLILIFPSIKLKKISIPNGINDKQRNKREEGSIIVPPFFIGFSLFVMFITSSIFFIVDFYCDFTLFHTSSHACLVSSSCDACITRFVGASGYIKNAFFISSVSDVKAFIFEGIAPYGSLAKSV